MRFFNIATGLFLALASFSAALPAPDAAVHAPEEGFAPIEMRQCRVLGARCVRNNQCCSGECHRDRCRRDD